MSTRDVTVSKNQYDNTLVSKETNKDIDKMLLIIIQFLKSFTYNALFLA